MAQRYDDKKFAGDITFGLEQTLACTATDFIDPPVSSWFQNRFGKPEHAGQEVHAWKAEFAGDASALFVFLGAQRYCPGFVKSIKRGIEKLLDPVYEKIGNARLQDWASRHDVDPNSQAFREKLDEWKNFQAGNLAKASVISAASVIANVTVQKALHNPRQIWLITLGKLVGASVTIGVTTATRTLLPRAMHSIDTKIRDRLVLPVIIKTHTLLGNNADEEARNFQSRMFDEQNSQLQHAAR